jgi:hypothetical protein
MNSKCVEGTIRDSIVEFALSLAQARYFVYVETVSKDGSCYHKDTSWNQMGYQIDII